MRKNGIMTLLVIALLLLTACRYEGKVKVYENTEQNEVSHEEESRTFVITGMDFENNIFTFLECVSGKEYRLAYHGGVNVYNIYGEFIHVDSLHYGSVVDVVYYSDTMRMVSITANKNVTTLSGIGKFVADPDNGTARYGGTTCKLWDNAVSYDGDILMDIREINSEDRVTLNIYRDELVSVILEKGHGYVRLKNQDTYIGGMIEIGYDVILPVTEDMLIAVREGDYTLRISKNGYSQSKDIRVNREEETLVDLYNLAIPTGTVIFDITPPEAKLYVGGKLQESHSYTGIYGRYNLRIEAEGYKTFRGSIEIKDSTKDYKVIMTALEEDDTTDDSSETTENTSDDTTEKNTENEASDLTEDEKTENTSVTEETEDKTDNVIRINKPANTDVYIDGRYEGTTPVSFDKTVGSHTITLYKQGYLIKSYTIYASDNGKDEEYSFPELEPAGSAIE